MNRYIQKQIVDAGSDQPVNMVPTSFESLHIIHCSEVSRHKALLYIEFKYAITPNPAC